ncbi:GDYXXLXY domain-containing protein [Mucilaginibacter sp.]|uniref:GDYXXLXY domain-containing protein n=1 Tax=Mucilaginibacter sp. TaxID=1882438 RepID=UPI003267090F
MSKTKRIIVLLNLLLLVGYFNWAIMAKEKTLSKGKLVLLRLAPVDPRSLMQGDYMQLNYEISTAPAGITKRGYCIVTLDEHGVAKKQRFQDELQPLKPGELAVKYFSAPGWRSVNARIGAESFFFEEGQGQRFQAAKYGGIKIDDAGNSVLEGLYDEHYRLIKY